MTKQEFLRKQQVNQMPKLVQVFAGQIYDEAYEAGRREGHRQGVDSVLLEQEEILRRTYDKGATEANHFGSAFFTAAACCALEDTYKFGRIRLKRFFDRLGYLLKTELTPAILPTSKRNAFFQARREFFFRLNNERILQRDGTNDKYTR